MVCVVGMVAVTHSLDSRLSQLTPEFDDMYLHEYPQLVRLATVLCGRRDVAEEIVQDAMLKALARWSTVREYDKPGAFVRRIVLNDTTSAIAKRRAELKALVKIGRPRHEEWQLDPEVDEFWRFVRLLTPRQAQVVALFYGDQQTTGEIAELLALAEGTIRATLAQARDSLRAQLLKEGGDL